MTIERLLSPEEEELLAKQKELSDLQEELSQKELDCETLRADILAFNTIYQRAVGPKDSEISELKARIARALYVLNPIEEARRQADAAEEAAREAAEEQQRHDNAQSQDGTTPPDRFTPSESLRDLYRNLVKQSHPDLGSDDYDRKMRNEFMARVNQAYQRGNEETLASLQDEWETKDPNSKKNESIGDQLVRLIRQLSDTRNRIRNLDKDISELEQSSACQLMRQSDEDKERGIDLISEIVTALEDEIANLTQSIKDISSNLSDLRN